MCVCLDALYEMSKYHNNKPTEMLTLKLQHKPYKLRSNFSAIGEAEVIA